MIQFLLPTLPKLIWRLNRGVWNETDMANTTGDEYSATLPPMEAGKFEYFYRVDFAGYAYTGPIHYPPWNQNNTPVRNLDDFSKWIDADDHISMANSPEHLPYFDNSHLYKLKEEPPQYA